MLSFKREGNDGYLGKYAEHRNLYGQKTWNSLKEIRDYQLAHQNETILNNNWQPYYYSTTPSQNYQLSFGRVMATDAKKQNKLGLLASVSYRNTQSVQALATTRNGFGDGAMLTGDQYGFSTSLGGMLGIGFTTKKHKVSWQNVFTQLLDEQLNYGMGTHEALGDSTRAIIEKVQQTALWQSQLKGEHSLGTKGIKINWTGSYTQVKRIRPDNHLLVWKAPENLDAPHNEFNVADWYGAGGTGTAADPAALRLFSTAIEKNFGWDVNIQVPFTLGITKNNFKAGYAGWVKDRRFYVALVGDDPGSYTNYPSIGQLFTPKYGGGRSSVSSFGDDYDRKAPLHAVYGMFDNRIANKLRLVWGVRAEYFDMDKANQAIDGNIKEVSGGGTQIDDFSALRNLEKKWQLFPSANLTYSITPKINIRAAYAKSIIRPDLREMAYFREYDFELGGIYQADFLQSTKLDNYDLRLEWYPGAGEVVSASFFYKNVKFPMEIYNNITTFNLQNNYKSNNRGIELEVRKSLSFLSVPVIKNLTVYGNFTALTSRVTPMQATIGAQDPTNIHKLTYILKPGAEEKRPLMGQSNYMGNAGLYYDDQHLHLSFNYNSISNRLVIYDVNILNWQFERPMRSLDAQVAYRFLNQRAEVKLNLSNLLNESILIYSNGGTPEETAEAAKGNYSQKYLLYDKNKDAIEQKITPGRTYGLTISYLFK
jgi:outer membrane receptor protein involved in Fe transport